MHVGLNLIYLVPREMSGLETYARELIPALRAERPDLELTAFVNREAASDDGLHAIANTVAVPVYGRRRASWVRGEQFLLPRLARRAGVDVVHSLASTAPATGPFARVVTIHDVIYRIHPEAHGWRTLAMRMLVPLAAKRSDRIIAPSQTSKNDIARYLGISTDTIDVIPNGVGATSVAAPTSERDLRDRYGLGARPFVLTVSLKRPNKNLERLVDALGAIPSERRPLLVLAGHRTPYENTLRARAREMQVERDTRFLPWVPAADLEGLYQAATAFVFPSIYEGFGLPVIEAMARGIPVACSDRGALREVADDAALFFDPEDPREIARAVETLLADSEERRRLGSAGRVNAARFTWAETARLTLATYERALEYSRRTT